VLNGVVKAGATGYDAKTGAYVMTLGPVMDESSRTRWTVLLVISWTRTSYPTDPYDAQDGRQQDKPGSGSDKDGGSSGAAPK